MSQVSYRGNLSARTFPFIANYFGQSVIVGGQDQNATQAANAGGVSIDSFPSDRGTPQAYYMHNVMPSQSGYQSIGYEAQVTDTKLGFERIHILINVNGDRVFFSHTTQGKNYILNFGGQTWIETTQIPNTAGVLVTTATINGQTFIFFANIGCYLYDVTTNTLIPIVLDGLVITDIIGIVSSAGYMIAWTSNAIAWSSTVPHEIPTDPIDFVPSLITGAGGGAVETAKGKITLCISHYLGFMIYTTDNTVASVYSGNARFPFNLREVVGAGGLANPVLVAIDGAGGNHYAYTTSGLQLISPSAAQTIFSEITDFVAGKYFEDFNTTTLQFEYTELYTSMKKAVNVISNRYLVISYGTAKLTHALVYDLAMKRFGKLKIPHVVSFEFKELNPEVVETPRASLGFLQEDGSIKVVDFSYGSENSSGVLILGKYQYVRSRLLQLQEVHLENIRAGKSFKCYDLISIDGKNYLPAVEGFFAGSLGVSRQYNFHGVGINHTLVFNGSFFLNDINLRFNIHGKR